MPRRDRPPMAQQRRSYDWRPWLVWTAAGVAASGALAVLMGSGPDLRWALPLLALAVILALPEIVNKTRKRRILQLSTVGVCAVAVVILTVWPPRLKLYYADSELDGAKIPLVRHNPDPRLCTTMHVWASAATGIPDSFAVCGVWMKKPDDAAGVTGFALYIDFSEQVTHRGDCRTSNETPDRGYKVALVCQGWPTLSPARWTLPAFFGMPIPTKDTKIRIRFEYGKNRRAEATFVLRPPERG